MGTGILDGRKGLVLGVANRRSLAWGVAKSLRGAGADLALTCEGPRLREKLEGLVGEWDPQPAIFECDVTDEEQVESMFSELESMWGELDFLVHSLAYAPRAALDGSFTEIAAEDWNRAMEVSAHSLVKLSGRAADMLERGGREETDDETGSGGSVVALSYLGSERVMPGYGLMGPCKAALESAVRYLAHDLGPRGIRVNVASPGPIKTLAASAVGDFSMVRDHHADKAFTKRSVTKEEVGDVVLFLCSDLSRAITGVTLHADHGYFASGV